MTLTWPFMPAPEPTEALEWLTDIIQCRDTEQRLAMRPIPRREFAHDYSLETVDFGRAREIAKSIGGDEFYLPIWTEFAEVGALSAGTVTLPIDATLASYEEGGKLLLWDADDDFEVCTIQTIGAGTITIVATTKAFSNAAATPIMLARFEQAFDVNRSAGDHDTASARFQIVADIDLSGETGLTYVDYRSMPFITTQTSMMGKSLGEQFERETETLDTSTGVLFRTPICEWSVQRSRVGWRVLSKADLWDLRVWLHQMRGRQKAFWLSSWNKDIEVNATIGAADLTVSINDIDFAAHYSMPCDFVVRTSAGALFGFQVTDCDDGAPGTEVLTIAAAIGTTVTVAEIEATSKLVLSRFDADRIEIQHGLAGAAAVSVPTVECPA